MATNPATIISRHPDTIATEIDGEVMLMSLKSGRTFGLDKKGSRIWELIEQPTSLTALVAALVAQYEITAEQCQADVAAFLDGMAANDLATLQLPAEPEPAPAA